MTTALLLFGWRCQVSEDALPVLTPDAEQDEQPVLPPGPGVLQAELFRVSLQEQDGLQARRGLRGELPGRRVLPGLDGLQGEWLPVWLREPDESSFQDERPEQRVLLETDGLRGEWLPVSLRDGRLFRTELRLDGLPVRDAPLLRVPLLRCGSVPLRC